MLNFELMKKSIIYHLKFNIQHFFVLVFFFTYYISLKHVCKRGLSTENTSPYL